MKNFYKKTKKEFKRMIKKNKNMTYHEWNDYAHENEFFSSITIMSHEDAERWEDLKKIFEL